MTASAYPDDLLEFVDAVRRRFGACTLLLRLEGVQGRLTIPAHPEYRSPKPPKATTAVSNNEPQQGEITWRRSTRKR